MKYLVISIALNEKYNIGTNIAKKKKNLKKRKNKN